MNHPDLDTLTADASDLTIGEERERLMSHLDGCPNCLETYARVCSERAMIESAGPERTRFPFALAASLVATVVTVAGLGYAFWPDAPDAPEAIRRLASPALRAAAAAELLRMGPDALAALDRGSKSEDAAVSRACQDLLQLIAIQDPADTRTLVSAVEEHWKSIQEQYEDGSNPWYDKKDFHHTFETWKKDHQPDAKDLEAAEKAVLEWFDAGKKPAGLEWRVRSLLSEAALERKDKSAAAAHLDRAIASYPDVKYKIPSKHSKFQHLVNARAMLAWDEKGADAAISYAAGLLVRDPRFHYFYSPPWDERFREEKAERVRAAMIERIRAAYKDREKKFPDDAEKIRKNSEDLK